VRTTAQRPRQAPDGAPVHCESRRPERTTPYCLAQQPAPGFITHTEAGIGAQLPRFIKDEFDAFLECGILAHGLLRLRCDDCAHGRLQAFSSKRRRFCAACGARRMSQTAAHRVDHVILHGPVRQWVLLLPTPQRVLLAALPELVSPVLQGPHRIAFGPRPRQTGDTSPPDLGGIRPAVTSRAGRRALRGRLKFPPLEKQPRVQPVHAAASTGATWKPRAAARRLRAAMLR
jgi:hypothetical protein